MDQSNQRIQALQKKSKSTPYPVMHIEKYQRKQHDHYY